jgi:hypothetical protein
LKKWEKCDITKWEWDKVGFANFIVNEVPEVNKWDWPASFELSED